MKVTYESLPKKFEEIKQHLTPGTIDAVQATLPIWEFYGDAEFKPSIDDVIELVNNELPDDEPAPAQPQKTETKEDKQKKEPKTDETRPETKKEPEKPAKKPAKAGKQPKQPKPKFKIGDWVKDTTTGDTIGKVLESQFDDDEQGFVYRVSFDDNVIKGDWYAESVLVKTTKPKKTPKAKEKKQPEGEPVAKISPEIAIIARFVKLTKKGDSEEARKTLAALQKHIVNKEIRKTSQYAKEIMDIQKALIAIVYKKQKPTFSETEFEHLEKISHAERQEPIAQLSRSFIMLIGKSGVKEKAKSLLEKFEAVDSSDSLVAEMVQALHDYVDGNTETIEPKQRSLQGIYGLAGI